MKEICIPIPDFLDRQIAHIEVTVNGEKRRYNYRIESFLWETEDDKIMDENQRIETRINRLKNSIENYEANWRLVQIFKPGRNSSHIQVLFRQQKD